MAKTFSVAVNIGGRLNSSLAAAVRAADAQVSRLGRRVQAVNTRTQNTIATFGRGVAGAGKKLQESGHNFSTSVSLPMSLLAISAARTVYEYEKAGNALQAVTEMTAAQRKEIEKLAKAQTYFSPVGTMQAAVELGKTGFNFEQIKGVLPGAEKLALAGDLGVGQAADITTNVLTGMRLPMASAEQAMRSMARVGDLLTYSANKTNTSVELLGETFKYVGPMAAQTGNSLEMVAAISGIMANNGIRGAEAGVALRSALVRMVRPTKPMIAALARLNVNLNDFVTASRTVSATDVIKTLQVRGIDASGAADQIASILSDPRSKFDIAGTTEKITSAIAKHAGGSAIDRDTIADAINEALLGAADKVDLVGFLKKLKEKGATSADVASIFDARQGSRLLTALNGDIPAAVADITKNASGYIDRAVAFRIQGIVGAFMRLESSFDRLKVTLAETGVIDTVTRAFNSLADSITRLGETNPSLLRFGTYAGLATIALGPLTIVAGGAMRAVGALATGLVRLGVAATVGLASQLVAVAGGIRAIAVASALGVVGRLRALAAGIIVLGSVGGVGAVLGAAGRAVLMFPVAALRAIGVAMWGLVANPVGATITAVVVALTALGMWVYNNWSGIQSFFSGFADGFSKALGPGAKSAVDGLVSSVQSVWRFVSDLLGPINATNEAWQSWGATVGGVVAAGVNAVAAGIERVIGLFTAAYDKAVALGNALSRLWGGGESASSAGAPAAPEVAGKRASGGPVGAGRPYLVGERGPEIFVPPAAGRIETNATLRRLSQAGSLDGRPLRTPSPEVIAQTAASRPAPAVRGDTRVENHFHINGAQDPGAVAREVERVLRRYESEQRGLLSD
jgi:TP901 family phage tail tape measure protein